MVEVDDVIGISLPQKAHNLSAPAIIPISRHVLTAERRVGSAGTPRFEALLGVFMSGLQVAHSVLVAAATVCIFLLVVCPVIGFAICLLYVSFSLARWRPDSGRLEDGMFMVSISPWTSRYL